MPTPAKVLFLDDSKLVLTVGRKLLESIGLAVRTIDSPAEFLGALREFRPDLVIVDIEMPAVAGPKLIEIARQHGQLEGVVVLLHSSVSEAELASQARSCGADGAVRKSPDGAEFLQAVKNVLRLGGELSDRSPLPSLQAGLLPLPPLLKTGVDWVDRHHQLLYDTVVRFDRAIQAGEGAARIAETLGFLRGYATFHFAAEERLMKEIDLPGRAAHEAAHASFRQTLVGFSESMNRDGAAAPVAGEVRAYLGSWLQDHVNHFDRLIATYLANRAVPGV